MHLEHYLEMGIVTKANSIKKLADKIAAPNLPATVERYNAMSKAGKDENFRVIRKDGTPIKGLYAAGEVLGSLEAHKGRAYTSRLLQVMVTGKITADSAVSDITK